MVKRFKYLLLAGFLVVAQISLNGLAFTALASAEITYPRVVKISDAPGGTESNGRSLFPFISGDGSHAAFQSYGTNLVADDTNGMMDIFVKNMATNATERVSLDDSDQQVYAASNQTDRIGRDPTISHDGRFVSFVTSVPSLTGLPSWNYQSQVMLRDRQTGSTTKVSTSQDGTIADAQSPYGKLSANGEWLAFYSSGTNLVPDDTNAKSDLFIKNLSTGVVERVSVSSDEIQANDTTEFGYTTSLDISADGRFVLFASSASNLVASDPNGNTMDVFLRDRQLGTTERFAPTDCTTMGLEYWGGTISDDGRWVALSGSRCTVGTAGKVTLFDRQTSTTSIVSGMDSALDFSADGRYLLADNSNVFLYDRVTDTSTAFAPNTESGTISASGNSAAYHAQDYYSQYPVGPQPGDTNQVIDAFVRQLAEESPIDSVPPTVSGTPDRAPNAAGWYNADVTIDWHATDPAPSSGTPTDPANTVASLTGENTYTSGQSCDPDGNCATGSLTIKIDKAAPQNFAILSPANGATVSGTHHFVVEISDATSDIKKILCNIGGHTYVYEEGKTNNTLHKGTGNTYYVDVNTTILPEGTNHIVLRATDMAGNTRYWNNRKNMHSFEVDNLQ